MSLASLEQFHKQMTQVAPGKVSQVINGTTAGKFGFDFSPSEQLDYTAVIDRIANSMGSLTTVVANPYIVLKSESDTVRMEQAGTLSPDGIRQTIADSRLWKKHPSEGYRPEFVYARTSDDEYNTYENRFVKALIDRLIAFLAKPMSDMRGGIHNMYEAHPNARALSKLDFVRMVDTNMFLESDVKCFTDYKRLFYLRAKLNQLRTTAFYKIMSKMSAFTDADPQPTNLLVHNADYNALMKLWMVLKKADGRTGELRDEGIRAAYCAYVYLYSCYAFSRKLGYTLAKDGEIKYADNRFLSAGVEFENEFFVIKLTINGNKILAAIRCKQTREVAQTTIAIRVFPEEPVDNSAEYTVSLFPTEYSDDIACVMPDNAQTLTNLETLLRCVVLVMPVEANIYDKLCLVCGSNAVENIGKKVTCADCGATYTFLRKNMVWINSFFVKDKA